jgi:hypothetical protein
MSNGKRNDIDELRGDIEDTRQRISGEIEATGDRLTPEHAKEVARERVRERVGEAKDRAIEGARSSARNVAHVARRTPSELPNVIRSNPIPTAMLAVGTGWLVWSAVQRSRRAEMETRAGEGSYGESGYGEQVEGIEGYTAPEGYEEKAGELKHRARERAEYVKSTARERAESAKATARERAQSLKSGARERAMHARERVGSMTGKARERVSERASSVRHRASDIASRGRERAMSMRERGGSAFSANPLAFGALALFTGIGIGMLLPHTRREDRMLGEPRERVVERARQIAHEAKDVAVHSAKEGVRVARETAKEDSSERNLIGGNI